MPLREKIHLSDTGLRRSLASHAVQYILRTDELPHEVPAYGISSTYELTLIAKARFTCNRAQFDDARDNAMSIIAHEIYGCIEPHVRMAISAIYANDNEAAITALSKVLDEIRG